MYFEDFPVGFRFQHGSRTLTREAIIDYARQWDPQPFHVDEAAAAESPYGGLIASGWHTLGEAFNLILEAVDWSKCSMGSPGIDEVRWLLPVRPGDSLSITGEVLSARASASKPDRGFANIRYEIFNQHGEKVAGYIGIHMLRCRP